MTVESKDPHWERVSRFATPGHGVRGQLDSCLGMGGVAFSQAQVAGETVDAWGQAADASPLCSVRSSLSTYGHHVEDWIHRGPGEGDIETDVWVGAAGWVDLRDADCGGAALGGASYDSNAGSAEVELERSIGSTSRDGGFSIHLGDKGIGFSGLVGRGEGRYVHYPAPAHVVSDQCAVYFTMDASAEADLEVWADAGMLGLNYAEVRAGMWAEVSGTVRLPHCPGTGHPR